MIASDARPATVRVMCTNEELMIAHPVLRSFETILAD
jgi:acetate kinase